MEVWGSGGETLPQAVVHQNNRILKGKAVRTKPIILIVQLLCTKTS